MLGAVGVDPATGLSTSDARERLSQVGPNELPEPPRETLAAQVARQLREPMALLLLGAAAVSGLVLGETTEAVAIVVIVAINGTIAVVEERRAASALEALRTLTVPQARVRRDGVVQQITSPKVVPGDVALLEAGDRVPADLRLIETVTLEIDESMLTGESVAARKDATFVTVEGTGLGDRAGVAHTGTFVTHGTATGVVVATGPATILASIARDATAARRPTPLQLDLARVTRQLALVSISVAAAVLVLSVLRTGPGRTGLEETFLAAVALAVAAVPEGLATITAVGLALGVRRMAERGAVVRRLAAVETLGSVTVLLVDKTGTLTENRMRVSELRDATATRDTTAWRPEDHEAAARVIALCNDATLDPPVGDPMELALLDAVGHDRVRHMRSGWTRVQTSPFDADRRRMVTVHVHANDPAHPELLVKGAPEAVVPWCTHAAGGGGLDDRTRARLDDHVSAMADTGVRVLAMAHRRLDTVPDDPNAAVAELELLGFIGLRDPVRAAAHAAVAQARDAGITLLMATGDHPATAGAVAAEVGIATGGGVTTGRQLRTDGLADDPTSAPVYARVDPDQKLALVGRLQERGQIVGMTGDGVNDAPALRRADIGIALGRRGSDVAREAADMVITDDDLATIVSAVAEGRRIYDNLRKVVDYLVAGNLGEIFVVVAGLTLTPTMGLPLFPLQLLWINLVTDGLPAIALGTDAADRHVMRRPPRPPGTRLLSWTRIRMLAGRAAVIAICVLGALATARLAFAMPWAQARTVMFCALVVAHLGYAFIVRRGSGGPGGNRLLLLATLGGGLAQVLLVVVPSARALFDVTVLPPSGWLLVAGAGIVPNLVLWAGAARASSATR